MAALAAQTRALSLRREHLGAIVRAHHPDPVVRPLGAIAGGKWTAYRRMAEDCVARASVHRAGPH